MDQAISSLNSLTTADPLDLYAIVDVSASETKKITQEDLETTIANSSNFVDELVGNNYFTDELANDSNFLTELTNNATFQTAVNSFVTGTLTVEQEGVVIETSVDTINITGNASVTNPVNGQVDINILGGSGGGGTKIAIDTTETIVSTGAPTAVFTIPIPGGILGTNNGIRYQVSFDGIAIDNGEDIVIEVTYGGTTVSSLQLAGNSDQISNTGGLLTGFIAADTATNAQKSIASIITTVPGNTDPVTVNTEAGVSAVDSTVEQDLVIVITKSGSGTTTIAAEAIVVEQVTSSSTNETNGLATRAVNAANGSQTIPHGLSTVPSLVKIRAVVYKDQPTASVASSMGIFDGTDTNTIWEEFRLGTSTVGSTDADTTNIIHIEGEQVATIAVDSTNITLTWTKSGTSAGTNINILWEAIA